MPDRFIRAGTRRLTSCRVSSRLIAPCGNHIDTQQQLAQIIDGWRGSVGPRRARGREQDLASKPRFSARRPSTAPPRANSSQTSGVSSGTESPAARVCDARAFVPITSVHSAQPFHAVNSHCVCSRSEAPTADCVRASVPRRERPQRDAKSQNGGHAPRRAPSIEGNCAEETSTTLQCARLGVR